MRCFVDPPDIYLYKDAIDFRKSINGLVMIVEQGLERSAFDPALYIFCNRARDKLIYSIGITLLAPPTKPHSLP